jgi:hypothetical protein
VVWFIYNAWVGVVVVWLTYLLFYIISLSTQEHLFISLSVHIVTYYFHFSRGEQQVVLVFSLVLVASKVCTVVVSQPVCLCSCLIVFLCCLLGSRRKCSEVIHKIDYYAFSR